MFASWASLLFYTTFLHDTCFSKQGFLEAWPPTAEPLTILIHFGPGASSQGWSSPIAGVWLRVVLKLFFLVPIKGAFGRFE